MKKCKSCGAIQKDERTVCVDCGERLGKPLTESELEALDEGLEIQLEEMSENADELRVTKFDLVLIILHVLSTVAAIVLTFINPTGDENMGKTLFYCLLVNALTIVELAFPSALWSLHTAMLSFRYANAEELEPGIGWIIGRKVLSFCVLPLTVFLIYVLLT